MQVGPTENNLFSKVSLKMTAIKYLTCLWTLLFMQTGFVCSEIQFLERDEGDSVVLPCVIEPRNPSPYGVYLKRSWLDPKEVLFKYTENNFSVSNENDNSRISVSGDPSSHSLNVTVSQLSASDTDRYFCEFFVAKPSSEDERIRGKTEFFLLVNGETPGLVNIGLVKTCSGGSAVLPCFPYGEALVVEGVSLKRQRGREPVEVLYHSKRHHSGSTPSSSSSHFPVERVQLSSAPGPNGITYNLTLRQLQADDSALYSCQLLVHGGSDSSTSLGRQVFFVSVQGGQCGCSNYSTLLYALSSAVVILLLLLLLGFVVIYKGKARRSVKSHPQAPIYEEMTGVQPVCRKLAPNHLEEMEFSEYRNCPVKKSCPENHYESPRGALNPQT